MPEAARRVATRLPKLLHDAVRCGDQPRSDRPYLREFGRTAEGGRSERGTGIPAVKKCMCITQCSSNPPHWTSWKSVGYVKGQTYEAAYHNCKQQAKGFCKALAWNYKHVKTYCGFRS